ncbi:MAG: ABC transporter permease [Clostridiales bacterium]|jgi:peptide/nickel transport system permease protein|nr:ABC transporter permease [Clostridiales bacterium]
MFKFIVKRLLLCVFILFFVMLAVYLLMRSLPTSYVETTARELATKPGSTKNAQQWIQELNAQYGLDKSPLEGFLTWMKSAVKGDFGESWQWTKSVTDKFNDVIWYSFFLGLIAFILEVAIAIPLGVIAATKQYSVTDYTVTVVSLIGISMPSFFVATVLKLVFAVKLDWFPAMGMETARTAGTLTGMARFLDMASHFVLPAVTLTLLSIGGLMRYTRTNTLEVLNADYIRTARAKGLPENRVIAHHAFRNTLIPVVTILGGSLPSLFSGALITETLFSIRGIGYTSYYSMIGGDIPFTMFYLTFISSLTLLGTLIADILYAVVDPRVRVN